jgi:hypothetical protein
MAQRGDNPAFDHQHGILHLGLVAGLVRASGQDPDAVVHGHFVIGGVEIGFVAAGPAHAAAEVIGDDQLRKAAQEFEGAHVGAEPILQALAGGGFGVGVVAGAEHGHKESRGADRAALRVVDGKGRSGVIHKELLACLMVLAQHHVQMPPPAPVEFAEAAVAVAVRVSLTVFFPDQLQRQMAMALEFLVKMGKVRGGPALFVDAP